MNLAKFCEVDPLAPRERHVTRVPLEAHKKLTITELYNLYRKAKSKAEKGALMRMMVPWNDIPPDIWKDLEDNFPIQKAKDLST